MISVSEAVQIFKNNLATFGPAKTYLESLSYDTLGESLLSDRDYPPFNRVMMDGIAISFENFKSGQKEFPIEGVISAGEPKHSLQKNTSCLEVMTGAPLPDGCDLVIPYEDINIKNGRALITSEVSRQLFDNVHLMGSDCKKGQLVLEKGQKLNGPHWGIAASIGQVELETLKAPKIMIVSTGNELVEVDKEPLPHQIRRSNAYAIKASLKLNGYEDVTLSHLADDPLEVALHYEQNSSEYDLLIYSGGVSKGKFDYLPSVWADMGVTKFIHGVTQRPGKPLWFGVDANRKTSVVGLPGNPVSSLVCLHRYIISNKEIFVRLSADVHFNKSLTYFLPVSIKFERDGSILGTPVQIKNSGEFTALAGTDGFIELPKEGSLFKAGEAFPFYPWRSF